MKNRRSLLAVAGVLVVVIVAGVVAWSLRRPSQPADLRWGCRSVPIDDPAAVGPSAREAVDRFLATGIAPADGWAPSEPNRFARSQDGTQMVINLNQSDPTTYTVVRLDTCGPGLA